MANPVHQDPDGRWYFWEETWADRQGPFESEDEARKMCLRYVIDELGYNPNNDESTSKSE